MFYKKFILNFFILFPLLMSPMHDQRNDSDCCDCVCECGEMCSHGVTSSILLLAGASQKAGESLRDELILDGGSSVSVVNKAQRELWLSVLVSTSIGIGFRSYRNYRKNKQEPFEERKDFCDKCLEWNEKLGQICTGGLCYYSGLQLAKDVSIGLSSGTVSVERDVNCVFPLFGAVGSYFCSMLCGQWRQDKRKKNL